jgi:hypothetical protein
VKLRYESFSGEGGDSLVVRYDNRGEPYRSGASIAVYDSNELAEASVFLERIELERLSRWLIQFLAESQR